MEYVIVWRKKGTTESWCSYTEYGDFEKVKAVMNFLKITDEYELVSITPDED